VSGFEARYAFPMKGDPITRRPTGVVTRQQLIDSRCDIPWADYAYAILNELSDGTKKVDLVYTVGKDTKVISEKSFDDMRQAVANLNERHRLENSPR
jgi:hypothetical protein